MPAPPGKDFLAALAAQRFRTIETAASEDMSAGWITPGDPTGDTFEAEDIDLDVGYWLQMRIDKKKLPTKWVAIHRAVAERSRGRPLSRSERQELNVELQQTLLPRVLPTVNLVDLVYVPDRKLVMLFATGTGVRDTFSELFHRTFDRANLLPMDPTTLAHSLRLNPEQEAYIEQVSPVKWPIAGHQSTPPAAPQQRPAAVESTATNEVFGDHIDVEAVAPDTDVTAAPEEISNGDPS